MTDKPTFKDAIAKFIHIGEVYYRGRYNDNVLNIFEELTEEDRKILLRTIYRVYSLVDKGEFNTPTERVKRTMDAPEPEAETANSFGTTSVFIMVLLLTFLFMLVSLFVTVVSDDSPNGAFKNLIKLFGFIL